MADGCEWERFFSDDFIFGREGVKAKLYKPGFADCFSDLPCEVYLLTSCNQRKYLN